jgi:hypothetical protein
MNDGKIHDDTSGDPDQLPVIIPGGVPIHDRKCGRRYMPDRPGKTPALHMLRADGKTECNAEKIGRHPGPLDPDSIRLARNVRNIGQRCRNRPCNKVWKELDAASTPEPFRPEY